MRAVLSALLIVALAGLCQGLVVGAADEPQWTKHTLAGVQGAEQAVCLDGTPGAYYLRPSATGSNDWIFFLMGGGVCVSPETCYLRTHSRLGTSSDAMWPKHYKFGGANGPLSSNCTTNPDFCNFNMVYVIYCDGLLYSGMNEKPVMYQNTSLYMRGSLIRQKVLQHVIETTGMGNASQVLLSGCSAGGLATFLHANTLAAYVKANIPSVRRVKAMPLSGFFLMNPNVLYQPILEDLLVGMLNFGNVTGQLDPTCRKYTPRPGACTFAEFAFGYSQVPTFAVNSKTDAWQIPCILLSTFSDDGQNFRCLKEQPIAGCVAKGFASCSAVEMAPILWYQQSFLNRVWAVEGFRTPGNGAFISSCFTHCEALNDQYWNGLVVGGVNMQTAVSRWWNDDNSTTPAKEHTYIDCMRPDVAPYQCNPTCHSDTLPVEQKKQLEEWYF